MVLLFYRGAGNAPAQRGIFLPPDTRRSSRITGAERFPEPFASGGPISFSSERNGGKNAAKNPWFLAAFLHPFAAAGKRMSRRSAKYSRRRHERNEQRAVGDAGPYGVRLSGCAGIRETADMGATVPLHDNRPARLRVGHGSGSDKRTASDSMRNLFVPWLESGKGNPKTVGFWRRSFPYFFRC